MYSFNNGGIMFITTPIDITTDYIFAIQNVYGERISTTLQ